MTCGERTKNHNGRLKAWLLDYFGNKCAHCPETDVAVLEFAHQAWTKIHGKGRGKRHRLYDIKNNLDMYILLCHDCHYDYDARG